MDIEITILMNIDSLTQKITRKVLYLVWNYKHNSHYIFNKIQFIATCCTEYVQMASTDFFCKYDRQFASPHLLGPHTVHIFLSLSLYDSWTVYCSLDSTVVSIPACSFPSRMWKFLLSFLVHFNPISFDRMKALMVLMSIML